MIGDAVPFLIVFFILAVLAFLIHWPIAATVFLILFAFTAYFFRNPKRIPPNEENIVVSPADGRVTKVGPLDPSDPHSAQLVSIFLSPFDVHVNRSPISGKISDVTYTKGRFINAMSDQASVLNEQNAVTVSNDSIEVVFKQIAGLIARRIVFWRKPGDILEVGELVGLIKFGSRTDIIVPHNVILTVKQGDRVRGGTSIIGRY
ncbi:MAG TPA: phosphatidylserine decarboxylase family protein [Blastocatellia bacterium]|nr:phosphatidylserine decarboxylase family protein [Blastocatellia bacterium]